MKKLIGEGCCSKKKGFTLIELLIVVAIIGLLATLAIVSLTTAQSKARDTKRVADLKSIQNAVEMYNNDNNGYPEPATATWDGLKVVLTTYTSTLPMPPGSGITGDYYEYVSDGLHYCLKTRLERANQALNQDNDVDDCNFATAFGTNETRYISSGTVEATVFNCDTAETGTNLEYCIGA